MKPPKRLYWCPYTVKGEREKCNIYFREDKCPAVGYYCNRIYILQPKEIKLLPKLIKELNSDKFVKELGLQPKKKGRKS